jgi:hypothetical protein
MWLSLIDGRKISIPLWFFPRLQNAKKIERENFEFSGNGTGIHWENLDEDISVEGLLKGLGDQTKKHKRS